MVRTGDGTTELARMRKARMDLILDHAFWGQLALALTFKPDASCKTAWTDGRRLGFNPAWTTTLTPAMLIGLIAHEVMHCAQLHHVRRGGRDAHDWNLAGDRQINGTLAHVPGITLPPNGVMGTREDALRSVDALYAEIHGRKPDPSGDPDDTKDGDDGDTEDGATCGGDMPKPADDTDDTEDGDGDADTDGDGDGGDGQDAADDTQAGSGDAGGDDTDDNGTGSGGGDGDADQDGGGDGDGQDADADTDPGNCGEVRDATDDNGKPLSDADRQKLTDDWRTAVLQAAQAAKNCGQFPAALQRVVDDALASDVNWKAVLWPFVERSARTDYTWTRPSRRYSQAGLYLPSLRSEELPTIVFFVDTSGSVTPGMLDGFASEFSAACEAFRIARVIVIQVDADLQDVKEYGPADFPVTLHDMKGGGGTDFCPGFDYLDREGIIPAAAIYLTDLYCNSFPSPPAFPVLWAQYGDAHMRVPFGDVIHITL